MSAVDVWEKFFHNCNLPSNVCRTYAQRFVKERIQPYMVNDLGKDELRELGINALGDQLSILRYIKSSDGMFHEFKVKNRPLSDNEDGHFMEDNSVVRKVYDVDSNRRNIVVSSRIKAVKDDNLGSRISAINTSRRISDQSRIIRKKPVMIQDISSSSPMPFMGSMRSDAISLKTIIVASPQKPRNLRNVRPAAVATTSIQNRRNSNVHVRFQNEMGADELVSSASHRISPAIQSSTINHVFAKSPAIAAGHRPISSAIVTKSHVLNSPRLSITSQRRVPVQARVQSRNARNKSIMNRISIVSNR